MSHKFMYRHIASSECRTLYVLGSYVVSGTCICEIREFSPVNYECNKTGQGACSNARDPRIPKTMCTVSGTADVIIL